MTDLRQPDATSARAWARKSARRRSTRKAPPRRDIQGLRALAVIAVIADHLFAWPSGGFVGVDVFFVISGFLITGILLRQHESTGTISATRFYGRRIKRIVPAATLVLMVTIATSVVLLPLERVKTIVADAVSAFFFVSNWRFAEVGTDYFAEGLPPSPLLHYWSLSIEEQFYFVWPWAMLGVLLAATKLLPGQGHARAAAGTAMAMVVAGSFAWSMYQTGTDANYAYFSTLSRVWELGLGALLAIAAPLLRLGSATLRDALGWVGLVGIVASIFVISAGDGFPAPLAALPVLATALVIAAGIGGDQRTLVPLTNKGAQYVGNISYSLYLWHFPVIILLAAVVETDTLPYYAIAVTLIAALSVASFHLVEDPARKATWVEKQHGAWTFTGGWKWVGVTTVAIPVLALVAYVLLPSHYAAPATSPFASFEGQSIAEQKSDEIRCVGAAAMVPANNCQLNTGSGMSPTPGNLDVSLGAFSCWLQKDTPFKVCHFGSDAPDATKIAIVGDSHAVLLIPAIREWLGELDWSIDSFGGENCQWEANGGSDQGCVARPQIQERLETGMYDAVITTTARGRYRDDLDVAATVEAYRQLWEPVIAEGTQVIVFADNPLPSAESLLCVQRVGFSPDADRCGTSEAEAYAKPDLPVLVADEIPGIRVIDMRDYFCADGFCPSVIGNVIVYRDEAGHMTEPYAVTLGQFLVPEIQKALRG